MSRDVAIALLSVAAPGGLPITPCIESVIQQREYVRFGMPLLRFRDAVIDAVIPGRVDDANLRCAIAHRGISRFRVRCFASSRNDDYSDSGAVSLFTGVVTREGG
jgi:hypothetical protein